ncbi:hypothetical protein BGX38DRAFT_1222118, partial [Terfezia claveryi]
ANITCNIQKFSEDITESELLEYIDQLNNDPSHISEAAITSAVYHNKDVDGFGTMNIGTLLNPSVIPSQERRRDCHRMPLAHQESPRNREDG